MPYNEAFRLMLTARGYSLLGMLWPRPMLPGGYPAAYFELHLVTYTKATKLFKPFDGCLWFSAMTKGDEQSFSSFGQG